MNLKEMNRLELGNCIDQLFEELRGMFHSVVTFHTGRSPNLGGYYTPFAAFIREPNPDVDEEKLWLEVVGEEKLKTLTRLLNSKKISPRMRDVFHCYMSGDYASNRQIAEKLNVSPGRVSSCWNQAVKRLGLLLGEIAVKSYRKSPESYRPNKVPA